MAKAGNGYNEIQNIKDDLDSLKVDVIALTRHLQEDGNKNVQELGKKIRTTGNKQLHEIEQAIKLNPTQSLTIAFFLGIALSRLLGHRKND